MTDTVTEIVWDRPQPTARTALLAAAMVAGGAVSFGRNRGYGGRAHRWKLDKAAQTWLCPVCGASGPNTVAGRAVLFLGKNPIDKRHCAPQRGEP